MVEDVCWLPQCGYVIVEYMNHVVEVYYLIVDFVDVNGEGVYLVVEVVRLSFLIGGFGNEPFGVRDPYRLVRQHHPSIQ